MNQIIEVKSGSSIKAALENIPSGPVTLLLHGGYYHEKLTFDRDDLSLISTEGAVISFDDHHGTEREGKVLGTGDSATVTVSGRNFRAEGITFENTFDYPCYHAENLRNPERRTDTQAVALRTLPSADNAVFVNCTFKGYQDTLLTDCSSAIFVDCAIEGNVDFIFGAGNALFKGCSIKVLPYSKEAYIAAPSTRKGDDIGLVFYHCSITADKACTKVYLARPWHPSGDPERSCAAAFLSCSLPSVIAEEGWCGMNSRTKDGTERYYLPEESIFLEWDSSGEGASADRDLLTCDAANAFKAAVKSFFQTI